jgi:hypothetical protein
VGLTVTNFADKLSELNTVSAQLDGGTRYPVFTGQVENNFNELNIFIGS